MAIVRSICIVAGYSETPLARKLGIKEGRAIAIVGSRDGLHNV